MDAKEMTRLLKERTEEAMHEKIDRILDDARDSGYLSHENIECLKDCWKAVWYARQACKES